MIEKFIQGIALSEKAHRGQIRKGTSVEYFSHPLAVAGDVLGRGGSYDQAIAGLCHDILEDCGPQYREEIRALGDDVLAIVEDASDCIKGEGPKLGWYIRKLEYLLNFQNKNPLSFLVVACDKIHNSTDTVRESHIQGYECLTKFRAPPEMVCWYFVALTCELKKAAFNGYLPFSAVFDLERNVEHMIDLFFHGASALTDNSDEGTAEYLRLVKVNESLLDIMYGTDNDPFVCKLSEGYFK